MPITRITVTAAMPRKANTLKSAHDFVHGMHRRGGNDSCLQVDHDECDLVVQGGQCHVFLFPAIGLLRSAGGGGDGGETAKGAVVAASSVLGHHRGAVA